MRPIDQIAYSQPLGIVQVLYVCTHLFLAAPRCEAQNLIPNGSFEDADTCWPYTGFYYLGDGPLGWFSGGESPDYFQICNGSGSDNGVPLNYVGYQDPQEGEDYAGVVTYAVTPYPTREFLMAQLTSPLIIGQTYYVSFYANAAWGGTAAVPYVWLASNNVGALFTVDSRQWEFGDPPPQMVNYAHVHHPYLIADTVGWTLVSGNFVADSAYLYVMIGNHFDNTSTDTIALGSSLNPPAAYLFIDNVCVSLDPEGCPLATGKSETTSAEPILLPNPAVNEIALRGIKEDASISVRDAVGRLVWEEVTTQAGWSLDVSEWARGTYLLCLSHGKQYRSFKFVLVE